MRLKSILVCVFLLLIKNGLFAGCSNYEEFIPCEKTYIQGEQISFFEKSIFVKIENSIVYTSAIFSDENGFYFRDYRKGDCDDGEWQCQHCDTCNPYWNTLCESCHRVNWKG